MSNLTPFPVHLKHGCEPALPRRRVSLSTSQLEWLRNHLTGMEQKGIISKVKNPRHGSAVFLVPKKGPKKWRMVQDMVPLNKITERTPLQMPLLEMMLGNIGKAKIFATFDALSGFDLLRTTSDVFVLITPLGSYRMNCAPMGWVNTPQIFQHRLEVEVLEPAGLLHKKDNGAGQWIDDTCLYSTTVSQFLIMIENLLKQVIIMKVRLNIEKCTFLGHEVEWCGRLVSEKSWKMHPKYYDKILQVGRPRYVDELHQAFYTANWLAPTIPNLGKYRDYFKATLQLHGEKARKVRSRNEPVAWTPGLLHMWQEFLKELWNASQRFMANYDPLLGLGVMVDASDHYWSCVVIQLDFTIINEPLNFETMNIRPMMFLSGEFTNAAVKWHISQKELFPILEAFRRFDFLLLTHPSSIIVFTDHKNLIHILRPDWVPNKSTSQRLGRWASAIQQADFIAVHIPGKQNVLADLLSRWGTPSNGMPQDLPALTTLAPPRKPKQRARKQAERSLRLFNVSTQEDNQSRMEDLEAQLRQLDNHRLSFMNPYFKGKFKRINAEQIQMDQRNEKPPKNAILNFNNGLYEVKGKIWIPKSLTSKVIVHNHIACFHNNLETELKYLNQYFFSLGSFTEITKLVKRLRQVCVHCQRSPSILKRPFQATQVPTKPREVLTMDYLYIKDKNYLLVLTDVFSRKVSLHHTKSADTDTALSAILTFRGSFGLESTFILITDQGSHFSNALMQELAAALRFTHTFSVAYCPWQNGAAEVANKRVLRHIRQLCSEFSLQLEDWVQTVPVVEHIINNMADKSKNGLTPNEIFMGFRSTVELTSSALLINFQKKLLQPKNSDNILQHTKELKEELDRIRTLQYQYIELTRTRARNKQNLTRKYVLQFQQGDWVMVSTVGTAKDKDKTRLKWAGPMIIVDIVTQDVYKVQDLNGRQEKVHASRMWYYDNSDFRPDPAITSVFNHDFSKYMIQNILDHKTKYGSTSLLISWLGFEDFHNSWEPLENIFETNNKDVLTYFENKKIHFPPDLRHLISNKQSIKKFYAPIHNIFGTVAREKSPLTSDWTMKEKETLRNNILRLGMGEGLTQISLPGKSVGQIYSFLRETLAIQDIMLYKGIRFDIFDVGLINKIQLENGQQVLEPSQVKLIYNRLPATRTMSYNSRECVQLPRWSSEDVHRTAGSLTTARADCIKLSPALLDDFPQTIIGADGWKILRNQESELFLSDGTKLERVLTSSSLVATGSFANKLYGTTSAQTSTSYTFKCGETEYLLTRHGYNWFKLVNTTEVSQPCYLQSSNPKVLHLRLGDRLTSQNIETLKGVHIIHANPDWCLGKNYEANSFAETPVIHPNQVKELNLARALVHGGLLFLWIPHMHLKKIFASLSETGLQPLRTITWITLGITGTLKSHTAYYSKRASDYCVVFAKGEPNMNSQMIVDSLDKITNSILLKTC